MSEDNKQSAPAPTPETVPEPTPETAPETATRKSTRKVKEPERLGQWTKETDLDEFIAEEQNTILTPNKEEITPAAKPEEKKESVEEKIKEAAENFIEKGIKEVKEKLADVGIKSSTMHLVIKYVIETVENFPTTGSARKSLALRIIKDLVQELPESSEKNFILETLNNGLVADTIDLIISATRGNIAVNVIEDVAMTCIPACIKYITEKIRKRKERKQQKKQQQPPKEPEQQSPKEPEQQPPKEPQQ